MSIGDFIRNSQVWKSIFRHPAPRDRRNRVVVMLTNVFLHLHPVSVRKSGINLSYTWCMGGLTFFLFLVETVTGVLADVLLSADAGARVQRHPGPPRRDHARHPPRAAPLGRPRHGHHDLAAHVPRLPHRQLQAAARIQLGRRRLAPRADAAPQLHRLPAAVGPARHLGHHGRQQHGPRHAVPRQRGARRDVPQGRRRGPDPFRLRRALPAAGRPVRQRRHAAALLRLALRRHPAGRGPADRRAFLARAQGRRHQRTACNRKSRRAARGSDRTGAHRIAMDAIVRLTG